MLYSQIRGRVMWGRTDGHKNKLKEDIMACRLNMSKEILLALLVFYTRMQRVFFVHNLSFFQSQQPIH